MTLRQSFILLAALLLAGPVNGRAATLSIERTVTVDQNVPDLGNYVSTVTWTNMGITNITDVNVQLSMTSAAGSTMRLGNMYATLTHGLASEDERVAVLLNRPGVNNTNAFGSNLGSLNVWFDDSVSATNVYGITNATGTYAADGRLGVNPYGPRVAYDTNQITAGLSALNGQWLESGTWSLLVADAQRNAVARLSSWSLRVIGEGASSGTIDPGAGSTISVTGTGTQTFGATVASTGTGANAVALNPDSGAQLQFEGGLAGSGDFRLEGAGTVRIEGDSSAFTGRLLVNSGEVQLASSGALGTDGRMEIAGTGSLLTLLDGVVIANLVTVTNGASGRLAGAGELAGRIDGTGSLVKEGTGTIILSASNGFAGGLFLNAGAILARNTGSFGSGLLTQSNGSTLVIDTTGTVANAMSIYRISTLQNVTLSGNKTLNNATYDVAANTTTTDSGNLSGAGGVDKIGAGTLVLSGANTFTGGVSISNGAVSVSADNNLGTNTGSVTLDGGKLLATTGFNIGAARPVSVAAGGGTFEVAASQDLGYAGGISGSGALTKAGNGTFTLSGSSSFSGTATVSAGVLNLANTSGQALGSAASVSVASGATLLISQANQVNDAADVSLSGGTIRTAGGVSEVFGNLSVTGNSFLDFGTTSYANANTISFGTYTTSALLAINNFNFGSTMTFKSELTSADLARSALVSSDLKVIVLPKLKLLIASRALVV